MTKSTWTGAIDSDWANAANWSPAGAPGKGSDVVITKGAPVASASIGTVHSITDSSQLYFESAGTNTVTTFLNNAGFLYVDSNAGEGGTILNIGTLTNSNSLTIGNATLSASDEVKAASLDNTGSIFLTGSSANQALLDVTGSAGFGTAGVLSGYVQLAGDSAIEFASGEITSLAGSLLLNGSKAFIKDGATGSNSALTGLANVAGSLDLENGASVKTGALANNGVLELDLFGGDGGSSLTVGGTLNNANLLSVGNSSLSSSDSVTASSLVNSSSGVIDLTGSATAQALLDITAAAGFGVAGNLTGTVDLAGDSAIEFASGQIARITTSSTLQLNGDKAFIEDATALGSNSALKGLGSVMGALFLNNQASIATSVSLLDAGSIYLDYVNGMGGSTLSTAGSLAISTSGLLAIGNGSLSSSSTVATAALNNSGVIDLQGAGANQALISVTGGSAGFGLAGMLTGAVNLTGNAAIEFVSGSINTIATGASLDLNGINAYIEDSTGLGSNSALTGLSTVSGNLELDGGAFVSVSGSLVNAGFIGVDSGGASGLSSLNIAGLLTNLGTLAVGSSSLAADDHAAVAGLANAGTIDVAGSAKNEALLDVTAGAAGFGSAGRLTGTASLSGDSAIEFVSGQITTVAVGGALHLDGSNAFIEDSKATGSNSALRGLSAINGAFTLDDGASVLTTGGLTNSGLLELDDVQGSGRSVVSVANGLRNNSTLNIGNGGLSGSDKLTAASLSNTGTINLTGKGNNQALLDVTTGVAGFGTAGTVTGVVDLTNDSAIEFLKGQIDTIGASWQLSLDGNNAFIEDGATNSNSALTSLANVAGSFYLANRASVSTTGQVAVSGIIGLDTNSGDGASVLSTTGALTNAGTLDIGNSALAGLTQVTADALFNSGTIDLNGSATNQALLEVSTGPAGFGTAGAVSGSVDLAQNSSIEFLSGQISTISAGSQLILGHNAFIEDSTALGSNSALHGLSNIAGAFTLVSGASVSTGSLTNNGSLRLDPYSGSSTLAVAARLTNAGMLDIGNSGLTGSDKLTAASFSNSGSIYLVGSGTNQALLDVSGSTTNNGSISITTDTETLAGAVGGAGSFSLSNANLQFGSSVSARQTINEAGVLGVDDLTLQQAESFLGTISGFGTHGIVGGSHADTIDAVNFLSGTTHNFAENPAGTGGTLTLNYGGLTANIDMTGSYSNANFTFASGGTGTFVTFHA
jgi:hypothetical protein